MKKTNPSIVVTFLVTVLLLSSANIASAGILDDFWNIVNPPAQTPVQNTPTGDPYNDFMIKLYQLNTPEAIPNLDTEMSVYQVRSVQVHVYGLPWESDPSFSRDFFVVKDIGVIREYPFSDRSVVLSYSQVMEMYPYFAKGQLSPVDKWQLYRIYRLG